MPLELVSASRPLAYVVVSAAELDELVEVQPRTWHDWPARFSCNARGEVWAVPARGYSRPAQRERIEGTIPILDEIVDLVLERRPIGGRFFIDQRGAWTVDELNGALVRVAEFLPAVPQSRSAAS